MHRRAAPTLLRAALAAALLASMSACSSEPDGSVDTSSGCDPAAAPSLTASCVEAFSPGEGAGFGMDAFPAIIFGEPKGGGLTGGGLDVLSLGKGGEITIGFGGNSIIDGQGPDFIVFENAFYVGGDPMKPFKELGEVSVSADGEAFVPFPCSTDAYPYDGCAGWHAVLAGAEPGVSPFDPAESGGDAFDLADVGLAEARFVRVRDLSMSGAEPNAGFDLDAITIVNAAR